MAEVDTLFAERLGGAVGERSAARLVAPAAPGRGHGVGEQRRPGVGIDRDPAREQFSRLGQSVIGEPGQFGGEESVVGVGAPVGVEER